MSSKWLTDHPFVGRRVVIRTVDFDELPATVVGVHHADDGYVMARTDENELLVGNTWEDE